MIIVNAGIPDSGTDWAEGVFRMIWDHFRVTHCVHRPATHREVEQFFREADPEPNQIVTLQHITPSLIRLAAREDVLPFFCLHDPQAVVPAQMAGCDISYERALQRVTDAYRDLTYVCKMPGIMLLPQEHLRYQPESLVFQMATRLGRVLSLGSVIEITRRMAQRELQSVPNAEEEADCRTLATEIEGVCLRVDEAHSMGTRDCQEKAILTPSQQALIEARFEPLNKLLGFETRPLPA
ncbi:MAG: hypothetical protein CMJ48_12365 [Planctomycetaceae bacterium]|nr:hypothetical protein [Planctomycetaceae bacterium]